MATKVEIEKLLKGMKSKEQGFLSEDSESSRRGLLVAARALVAELESPATVLSRMCWFEVSLTRDVVIQNIFHQVQSRFCPDLQHSSQGDMLQYERQLT